MKFSLLSAFCLAAWWCCSAPLAAQDKTKALAELKGYWRLIREDNNAPPGTQGQFRAPQAIYVDGDEFHPAQKNGLIANDNPIRVRIDPAQAPATMDFKIGNGFVLGIYKIEGDVLTIATQQSRDQRPKTFDSNVDAGQGRAYQTLVYGRVLESAEDAAARAPEKLDPKTQVLDGLWALVDREENHLHVGGHYPYADEAIYFEGNTWMGTKKDGWPGGRDGFRFGEKSQEFTSNPNADPPTIDFKHDKAKVAAIYKVIGDDLWLALNAIDDDRPNQFSTKLTAGKGRAGELRRYRRILPTPGIANLMQPPKTDPAKQTLSGLWIIEQKRSVDRESIADLHQILEGYRSFERHLDDAKRKGSVDWTKTMQERMALFEKGNKDASRATQLRLLEAVLFEKNKWINTQRNGMPLKHETYAMTTDATKPFPTIDLRRINQSITGIYKIEGDALYFATNFDAKTPPRSFTTNLAAGPARARCVVVFRKSDRDRLTCGTPPALPLWGEMANPKPKAVESTGAPNGYWLLDKVDENPPPVTPGHQGYPSFPRDEAIVIEGNALYFANKQGSIDRKRPLEIRVDPTKNPKTIDYRSWGDRAVWRGIYKVEDGKLTVATRFAADVRPDKFSTALDAGPNRAYHVGTYVLAKETAEHLRKKALAPLDPDEQKLDGYWVLDDFENNHPHAGTGFDHEGVYFEGNRWFAAGKDGSLAKELPATFVADPKAVPPTLDFVVKDRPWHAIYKIENDRLTIATKGPDNDRPTWFTTKLTAGLGRAHSTRVYKRVHPTDEVLALKQTAKADPAMQNPDGLWIVQSQSLNRWQRPFWKVGEAFYVEGGKWRSATKTGKLTQNALGAAVDGPVPTVDLKFDREVFRCIYKVDGDKMTLASNLSDDERPCFFTNSLTAGPGRASFVATLKRAKIDP